MFKIMAKEVMINVRLAEAVREEFKIAAELRGASMAGLLHQFIVKTIREEKEREPQAFKKNEETLNNIKYDRGGQPKEDERILTLVSQEHPEEPVYVEVAGKVNQNLKKKGNNDKKQAS